MTATIPSALRSKLSRRQRQTTYAATSTATTAATISRADMAREGTSAKLRDERAGQLLGGPLGSGAIGEQAEAGGARAADGGAERARGPQGVESLLEIRAE